MNIQKVEQQTVVFNDAFAKKANSLIPTIYKERIRPKQIVEIVEDSKVIHGWRTEQVREVSDLQEIEFGKGDSVIVDFGDHEVGYVTLKLKSAGSPPDAPLHVKLTFGEMPVEVAEPFSSYDGWLSSSWLQEESVYVDVLPHILALTRRYSFRYVKIDIIDTSPKYRVIIDDTYCDAVSSAQLSDVYSYTHEDSVLAEIDQVSIKTLKDCMQEIFEDGPKRDRRLWLGDLRLQALANYNTFATNDLVKRCLYLFAAVPNDKGQVAANVFIQPSLIADDTYLYDYSLFFTTTLHDYYEETKDEETLKELWPTAYRQLELGLARLDERHIVQDDETWWSFIDWNDKLNKQAPSQAVLIYALRKGIALAQIVGACELAFLEKQLADVEKATKAHLWDETKQFFVSGKNKQVSWAAQVWMVLAGVLKQDEGRALMERVITEKPPVTMNTPYMYHHFVEALLKVGMNTEAIKTLKAYWGGMLEDGADTFWELYNPNDKTFSPYGSHLINSYCHAWSCTPTYLIRKYEL
ncbi:sugar hydrolase [Halalkalibacter sp. APA_J-10(15)]|uniref:alpha-L-rhamnosidase-related protein n=1 Tax=unclassified Halalkalibacter TaxID=2893063 RepID=UPI001FF3F475|nr:sugar hydrolase [Halalkalibacter sp. APA_J-10(15)]MCK0472851.1 sugar hydrolase [Halalkalibacter sp. APA_J-10(15)]